MKQITIRDVDERTIARAREIAREKGTSFNAVCVEALARGLGTDGRTDRRFTDLSRFIGDWEEDPAFDDYLRTDLQRVDPELWR